MMTIPSGVQYLAHFCKTQLMEPDALELSFLTVALCNAKGNSTICKIVISFREQINDDGNRNVLLLLYNYSNTVSMFQY